MHPYKEWIAKFLEWLLKLASPSFLAALLVWEEDLAKRVDTISSIWRFRLLALLLSLSLGLVAWLILSRTKLKFIKSVGAWLDVKTGIYYCHSCKVNKHSSPLRSGDGYLRCVVRGCGTTLDDPDYVAPPKKDEKPKRPERI